MLLLLLLRLDAVRTGPAGFLLGYLVKLSIVSCRLSPAWTCLGAHLAPACMLLPAAPAPGRAGALLPAAAAAAAPPVPLLIVELCLLPRVSSSVAAAACCCWCCCPVGPTVLWLPRLPAGATAAATTAWTVKHKHNYPYVQLGPPTDSACRLASDTACPASDTAGPHTFNRVLQHSPEPATVWHRLVGAAFHPVLAPL